MLEELKTCSSPCAIVKEVFGDKSRSACGDEKSLADQVLEHL